MYKSLLWLFFSFLFYRSQGQALREFEYIDSKGRTQLAGLVPLNMLKAEPYSNWFQKSYMNYYVNEKVAKRLGKYLKDMDIQVFMGTWCGDSKREIPRLVRVLEVARIDPARVNYVCVYAEPERRNMSPTQEQKGRNIHHVPTIILFKNGKEVGRVIESPLLSLEEDLLEVVESMDYPTKYPAAEKLNQWAKSPAPAMSDSLFWTNMEKKVDSLSPRSPYELNALARTYHNHGDYDKEAFVLKVNSMLFPGFLSVQDKLAEALLLAGRQAEAQKIDEDLLKEAKQLSEKAKKRLDNQ
jgi:thiol-disulfide isomerase/thioredoxin